MPKPTHTPRLKIIEAIPPNTGQGQERTVLTEFLQMKDESYRRLQCKSFAVDNRYKGENLKEHFFDHLFARYRIRRRVSKKTPPEYRYYRYVHISAHGDGDSIFVGSDGDVQITSSDITDLHRGTFPLRGALITLSACGSLLGSFPKALADHGANAVIRPLDAVGYQESAMFFILFYFILSRRIGMLRINDDEREIYTSDRIAEYIDIYQRAKMSHLNIGGTGTYRLDYWIRDRKGRQKEHVHLF